MADTCTSTPKDAGRFPCVVEASERSALIFQCQQCRERPCRGAGQRTTCAGCPTQRPVHRPVASVEVGLHRWRGRPRAALVDRAEACRRPAFFECCQSVCRRTSTPPRAGREEEFAGASGRFQASPGLRRLSPPTTPPPCCAPAPLFRPTPPDAGVLEGALLRSAATFFVVAHRLEPLGCVPQRGGP